MEDGGHLENTRLQCIACTLKHIVINLYIKVISHLEAEILT